MVGLIIGVVVISAIFVIYGFSKNFTGYETGSSVEDIQELSMLENVIFDPSDVEISIGLGEEKTGNLEITNNNKKTLFFRCGIYDAYSNDKFAPQSSCSASDEEGTYLGFVEIPSGEKKSFTIKITTKKGASYMNLQGGTYTVTTKKGIYANKILISFGEEAKEEEKKEFALVMIVD